MNALVRYSGSDAVLRRVARDVVSVSDATRLVQHEVDCCCRCVGIQWAPRHHHSEHVGPVLGQALQEHFAAMVGQVEVGDHTSGTCVAR